jgi:hypothetical protein
VAFSEVTKLDVKRRAHFCCCLCHALGVEVHHIVPQAEGGLDTADNAAPLCPSCHETYGANPEKRKFIREARQLWYEICEKRYAADPSRLEQIANLISGTASKEDLAKGIEQIIQLLRNARDDPNRSASAKQRELQTLAGSLANTPFGGVSANKHCRNCNTYIGLLVGDTGRCPNCGSPW